MKITIENIYKFYKKHPEYIGSIQVLTRFGYKQILACDITAKNSDVYELTTEKNHQLKCSPDHKLLSNDLEFVKLIDLDKNTDLIFTKDGPEKIKCIKKLDYRDDLYDIEVEDVHEYYSNDIISHNSSLINAFVFCLFGKMLNQMTIKNVSNRFLPVRPTEITIELTVDDRPYFIFSGIKINPCSGYCKVYKDDPTNEDNNLSKHSVRETRAMLEKEILHTDFDVFLRSFVLTSDQFYNFFKMSKQDKRVFIENIFDLKIFGEMYRTIHKDNLDNDRKLDTFEALVTSQTNDINELTKKHQQMEKARTTELNELDNTITKLKTKVDHQTRTLSKYKVEDISTRRDKLQQIITDISSKKSEIESKIASKKYIIRHKKSTHAEKVQFVKKYIQTYKEMSDHSKPIMLEKLGLNTVKQDINQLAMDVKADIIVIKSLKVELDNCLTPTGLIENIEKLNSALNKIREIKTCRFVSERSLKEKQEYKSKIETSPSIIQELLTTKQSEYDKTYKDFNESSKKKNILTFIEKIVSEENIRKLVVSDLIKLLNNQIQTYLTSMGSDFTCMFDENLNYTFLTKNGETEHNSFSGGEKMRLSIAISMAFRDFIVNRSGINSNVLILDEYIDGGIDNLAVTEIFKILRELHILYDMNIYVISHREAVKLNSFDSIISIDKTNGISRLVEL